MKINIKKTVNPPSLRIVAIKIANITFLIAILFFAFIGILATYKTFQPFSVFNYLTISFVSFSAAFLLFLGFFLKDLLKINISLSLLSIFFSVYFFELFLGIFSTQSTEKELSVKKYLKGYDNRKIMDVVADFSENKEESFPYIGPLLFINSNGLENENGKIYPLGGIPNVRTVFCNESGSWTVYKSDKHGFNNPQGLYKKNEIDILLIGDSMADGACVKSDEGISSAIRRSGFNLLNISRGGNGPLLELATLKEYGQPFNPKIVLWQFYQNDFRELEREVTSSILRRYLNDKDFSQNLIFRRNEVEEALRSYFLKSLNKKNESDRRKVKITQNKIFSFIKLQNLRTRIGLTPKAKPLIFKKILKDVDEMVSSWGGKLYFVYIPSGHEISNKSSSYANTAISIAKELQIPVINIKNEVTDSHPDPLSLFPLRQSKHHYNSLGYELIAKAIIKKINF